MNYQYLLKHKELFLYVIGITYNQFEKLLPKFSHALRVAEHKKAYEKERIRAPGAGRKSALKTDRQKLFFILFYYKVYPTLRFAQVIFEFDNANVYRQIQFLEPVLFKALGRQLELPKVRVKGFSTWLEVCPRLKEFIVDATERPINRPKDPKKQKHYYSGKKKRHTVKNQLTVDPKTKKILTVSETVEGKLHDKKLFEKDRVLNYVPPGATGVGDLGYQGVKPITPLTKFITPKKKPSGGKLSKTDKATNKNISSIRVRVEHPLSYLKHFAILANRFRNKIEKAHQPFVNLACLYNFTRTHR